VCSVFGIDRTPNDLHDQDMPTTSSDGTARLREVALGLGLGVPDGDHLGHEHADLILLSPDGGRVLVEVKRTALVSADGLTRRLREWDAGRVPGTTGVVVADRVTAEARGRLREAGWGWLDLRGHLHLAAPGMFVDASVPTQTVRTSPDSEPLSGGVALGVAVVLLLEPDRPVAVRPLARQLGRAPSSVSAAVSGLRAAGLLDRNGRAQTPELFWELAGRWDTRGTDLATLPDTGRAVANDALRLNVDDIEQTSGWALSDTLAAAAYGASVAIRADHPPDFYVPDETTLRRAVTLLGRSPDHAGRAATARVGPVPLVCTSRVDPTDWRNQRWPLAQPLFVALDLAQDPGRGREILNDWTPPEPWHRVW